MKSDCCLCAAIVLAVLSGASALAQAPQAPAETDLVSLVNPLVGTDRSGNTFPGAVAPFGMAQLTPNLENNGYFWNDTHMHGFAMNSMSGDGCPDEGQILMTATTGPVKIDRADTDFTFDHQHETAEAGYYQVMMQPWGINAELTASTRCGMARFTFPAGKQANILVPISYANMPTLFSHVHVVDDHTVVGDVSCEVFLGSHHDIPAYFAMAFSQPFATHGTWTNGKITEGGGDASEDDRQTVVGFYGSYPASNQPRTVEVRIGMSYVDRDGAMKNLQAEMPSGSFDRYHSLARDAWNKELARIKVQGGTLTHRRIFYTALYHAMLAPEIFDDVDGSYSGFDGKIHTVPAGHTHFYSTYSGWDIYRSQIPLLAIVEPQRCNDMAQSIVEMAKQLGYIDRWPQLNQPTGCMNGSPLTICLVNLWNAGIRNFDMDTAYKYMWRQAQSGDPHLHIGVYQQFDDDKAAIEEEKEGVSLNADVSVSTALEYDESFAALGHLAESLGKPDDANYLFGRAYQYRNMYNPATGYLQGRDTSGQWDAQFQGYTEGNKDIYLWFVPEDIDGLVDLMGGAPAFDKRLDAFFDKGLYDSTNEPDLQAPFLYDYINRPWKTQRIVAETADRSFTDSPGGLAGGGNDDLGTMSAWYVLTQLGFYPVDPAVPYFEVCTPRFERVEIALDAPHVGTRFVIDAPNAGNQNEYIQSAVLNGAPLTRPWFDEAKILSGGTFTVQVGDHPNTDWASSPVDRPYSLSTGFLHVPHNPSLTMILSDGRTTDAEWRYTTGGPADDWVRAAFDDSTWRAGDAGFGTDDEGVTARTPWTTDDIWMRRTFTLPASGSSPVIVAYHDQDIDVFLNGIPAAHVSGWTHSYDAIPIAPAARATLQPGKNIIAVHVHHPGDGRHFADIGIADMTWPEAER